MMGLTKDHLKVEEAENADDNPTLIFDYFVNGFIDCNIGLKHFVEEQIILSPSR